MPKKEANSWEAEWLDMPEFDQPKQEPYAKIILRVRNAEDLAELEERLEQKLTPKTKSAWFPKLIRGVNANKRWVDVTEVSDIHSVEGTMGDPSDK